MSTHLYLLALLPEPTALKLKCWSEPSKSLFGLGLTRPAVPCVRQSVYSGEQQPGWSGSTGSIFWQRGFSESVVLIQCMLGAEMKRVSPWTPCLNCSPDSRSGKEYRRELLQLSCWFQWIFHFKGISLALGGICFSSYTSKFKQLK